MLAGVGSVAAVPLLSGRAGAHSPPVPALRVPVYPRREWADGLGPAGPLAREDVRFLLVHHTASGNRYAPDDVPGQLRSFHRLHTSAEKGWPDIAYNFLVDRFGGVWEGRTGSLDGPVRGDATGGSQGFAQLCCFIGDHSTEPPTPEAVRAMTGLLAALADRYDLDTSPGATATVISRGSGRWPAGASLTTATIAGHRDMSQTSCPGDAAYRLVRDVFPAEVTAARVAAAPAVATPPAAAAPVASPSAASPSAASPSAAASSAAAPPAAAPAPPDPSSPVAPVALTGGGVLLAGAAGLAAFLRRRARPAPRSPGGPPT